MKYATPTTLPCGSVDGEDGRLRARNSAAAVDGRKRAAAWKKKAGSPVPETRGDVAFGAGLRRATQEVADLGAGLLAARTPDGEGFYYGPRGCCMQSFLFLALRTLVTAERGR
ncbi:hypothetical protein MRX96_010076 [Rhipicephalus microplus]